VVLNNFCSPVVLWNSAELIHQVLNNPMCFDFLAEGATFFLKVCRTPQETQHTHTANLRSGVWAGRGICERRGDVEEEPRVSGTSLHLEERHNDAKGYA
jgi:hypothetical protein